MAAAVAVDDRMLALPELAACAEKRRVGHLGIGRAGDAPAYGHAVEAVDYGREVGLAGRDPEFRDVRDPYLVGGIGAEMVGAVCVPEQGCPRHPISRLHRSCSACASSPPSPRGPPSS